MTWAAKAGGLVLAMLAVLVLPAGSASGRAGELDLTFGQGGISLTPPEFRSHIEMAVEADGDVILIGYEGSPVSTWEHPIHGSSSMVWVTRDGKAATVRATIDEAFFERVAVQPDGRIVVAGGKILPPRGPDLDEYVGLLVARFNPSGNLDQSFGADGIYVDPDRSRARALALSPDGSILVGEGRTLTRLNAAGVEEQSYVGPGWENDMGLEIASLAVDAAGRPIIGGETGPTNHPHWVVQRLTAAMVPDPTFVGPQAESGVVTEVATRDDGKVVLLAAPVQGGEYVVARLTDSGEFDRSFGSGGKWSSWEAFGVSSMTLTSDDRIVLSGYGYQADVKPVPENILGAPLARLNANGTPDMSFGAKGLSSERLEDLGNGVGGGTGDVALQPSGTILATVSVEGQCLYCPFPVGLVRFLGKDPRRCAGRKASIVGWRNGETLKGTNRRDVIAGIGGDDTVFGGGGRDIICGGVGDDSLHGGKGRDRLYGGPGQDELKAGPGFDLLKSGKGSPIFG